MKKYICVLFVIVISVVCICVTVVRCTHERQEVGDYHMNHIEGKVIEIIDDKKVIVETIVSEGEYPKGTRIIVQYDSLTSTVQYTNLNHYTLQENDIVNTYFHIMEKKDGDYYIEAATISVYVDDNKEVIKACEKIIQGTVAEIIGKDTIKFETTKERGGYKKGEQIVVKYKNVQLAGEDVDLNKYEIQQNDEVVVQFEAAVKMAEYDYVETDTVGVYVNVEETSN